LRVGPPSPGGGGGNKGWEKDIENRPGKALMKFGTETTLVPRKRRDRQGGVWMEIWLIGGTFNQQGAAGGDSVGE